MWARQTVGRNALRRSSRASPASLLSQSWPSFRCATSGSLYLTPKAGSCGRRYRAARKDARRRPVSSASSRNKPSTTRTCMMTPTCRTCSASLGRASRSTVALCQDMRRRTAVSGCPTTSPDACFGMTKLGMRVIVAPTDVAPVEIVHRALFPTQLRAGTVAAARAAEADEAARKADQARLAAVAASRAAARAMMRVSENLKVRAEAQLAAADRAVASAGSAEAKEQAEEAKAKAVPRASELEAQWAAAKAELQPKFDSVASAREAAAMAENARVVAAEAARKAALDLAPVSVFISRKSQRLYVRQAFRPILESPVTIRDADRP